MAICVAPPIFDKAMIDRLTTMIKSYKLRIVKAEVLSMPGEYCSRPEKYVFAGHSPSVSANSCHLANRADLHGLYVYRNAKSMS